MTRAVLRAAAAALALGLAGCGNYSTEDLRFLAALPQRDDLRVAVPAQQGNPGAATVCTMGSASVWLWAKPTSDGLNAGVDFVVGLIDAVRRYPPTWRGDDSRRWGPFDAERHPGREIQIRIERSYPAAAPVYQYWFEARVKGTPTWTTVLAGSFEGASASRGRGDVELYFDRFHATGMNDPDTPYGTMRIVYDRASDPVTIDLLLTQDGFGVVQFAYSYAGYRDGRGAFDYRFRNATGDVLTVATGFDAAGAGRSAVDFVASGGGTGNFRQCWDAAACLTYTDDPLNLSCDTSPCSGGDPALCVSVPVSPF